MSKQTKESLALTRALESKLRQKLGGHWEDQVTPDGRVVPCQAPTNARRDATVLLEGLSDLAPAERLAAEGRLIEALDCRIAETTALLTEVVEAVKSRT